MTTPDPAQAAAAAQLADVAGSFTSAAPAAQVDAAGLAAAGGIPAAADPDALLKQLQDLEAKVAAMHAAQPAAAEPAKPATPGEELNGVLDGLSGQPAGIVHAFRILADHLFGAKE